MIENPPLDWTLACAFFFPGRPKPWERSRFRQMGDKQIWFPSKNMREFTKDFVTQAEKEAFDGPVMCPITGPIKARLTFLFPRKKSWPKSVHPGRIPYFVRLRDDADNLLKLVMDGLTKSGVIEDDGQIMLPIIGKWHHAVGEEPGTEIRLYHVKDYAIPRVPKEPSNQGKETVHG